MKFDKTKYTIDGLPSDIEKGLCLVRDDLKYIKIFLSGEKPPAHRVLSMGVEQWVSVCGFGPRDIDSEVIGLYDKLIWNYARTTGDDPDRIMRAVVDIYIDLHVAVQMWGLKNQ